MLFLLKQNMYLIK